MNEQNLIPNSKRTREELQEMGRKGGIKSGEVRRQNREQMKNIKIIAKVLEEHLSKESFKLPEDLFYPLFGRKNEE